MSSASCRRSRSVLAGFAVVAGGELIVGAGLVVRERESVVRERRKRREKSMRVVVRGKEEDGVCLIIPKHKIPQK